MMDSKSLLFLAIVFLVATNSIEARGKKKKGGASLDNRFIHTDLAPPAIGPYNQAIRVGATLYISGQLGIDPVTKELKTKKSPTAKAHGEEEEGAGGDSPVELQTEQAMENMKKILEKAGTAFVHVVKTTIMLHDINDFTVVNKIYGKYFKEGQGPARSTFAVAGLPKNALVEIDAIAVLP